MQLFFFDSLINQYSVEFMIEVEQEGAYVDGVWTSGESKKETRFGAILPVSDKKVYASNGAYTTNDRQLYMLEALGEQLDKIKVHHGGKTYTAEMDMDCHDLGGFFVYALKAVNKFD